MSTYFERNRQAVPQWNRRRRNGHTDSGVVVVHTYEAPAGRSVENGANYLRTRTSYGSYHWLADALGDTLHLAPWSAETWHETTVNNWAVGISMMAYAADWKKITATQRRNLIKGAALGAHRYSRWRVSQGKSAVPARRISRAQALAKVPGFIGHGEIDTKRRTDPGRHFPWDEFLAEYARLERGQHGVSSTSPTSPSVPEGHLDMHPDELNKHLSRHAENIHAAVQGDIQRLVDDIVRKRDNIQNTALHNMVRRELALAIGNAPGVDIDTLAPRLAGLLADDVRDAVAESIAEAPDRDAAEVADAVVSKIAHRLTQED